jgi:hypothetical protein
MAKLIISGTRNITDVGIVTAVIERGMKHMGLTKDNLECVLHGDSRGVDRVASAYFAKLGVPVKPYPADWNGPLAKKAGLARNDQMAKDGTHLIAIWDGNSHGTRHMVSSGWSHGLKIYTEQVNINAMHDVRMGKLVPDWIKKQALAMQLVGEDKSSVLIGTRPNGELYMHFDIELDGKGDCHPMITTRPLVARHTAPLMFMVNMPYAMRTERHFRQACGEFFARLSEPENNASPRNVIRGLPFSVTITTEDMKNTSPENVQLMYKKCAAVLYGVLLCLENGRLQLDHVCYIPKTFIEVFGSKRTCTHFEQTASPQVWNA